MSVLKFKAGRRGTGGKNAGYITRESACDSISFHNLNELEAESHHERRVNALSYAHNREDEEMHRSARGRTHYRVILSWDREEETDKAKEMTHEFLDKNFDKSRAVVAVHQDTEHTHAHIWIDARNTDERKLHSPKNHINEICRSWQSQYDREYQTDYAKQFAEKREETRQYKEAMHNGEEAVKPERPRMTSEQFREKDLKDAGVKSYGIDKEGFGGNQRSFEIRDSNSKEAEQTIDRSRRQIEQGERAVSQLDHKASGAIRETQELHHSVEKYGRGISEKITEKNRGLER